MLGFHTLFGGVMLVAAFGSMGLSLLLRGRIHDYRLRPSLELAAVLLVAFALASPYLYAIMHLHSGTDCAGSWTSCSGDFAFFIHAKFFHRVFKRLQDF